MEAFRNNQPWPDFFRFKIALLLLLLKARIGRSRVRLHYK